MCVIEASTALGVASSIFGAVQQSRQAAYNAAVAQNNAIAQRNAAMMQEAQFYAQERSIESVGARRAERIAQNKRARLSTAATSTAASGVQLSGSAADVVRDEAEALELEYLDSLYETETRRWENRNQAAAARYNNALGIMRADSEVAMAKRQVFQSRIGLGRTLLEAYPKLSF